MRFIPIILNTTEGDMKFRKKPVIIDAIRWVGNNLTEIIGFCDKAVIKSDGKLYIKTLEGDHLATPGDFIIKGVKGEFYPCKPDIFEMTYEPVVELSTDKQ